MPKLVIVESPAKAKTIGKYLGRVYYGCSNYPKCNYMTWDEPVPEKCPQCGSTLFKKKGQLYCAKEGCGFVKAIEKK